MLGICPPLLNSYSSNEFNGGDIRQTGTRYNPHGALKMTDMKMQDMQRQSKKTSSEAANV